MYNVAVVGATGAVGTEFLKLLETRAFPLGDLRLLASERSAGRTIPFRGESVIVEAVQESSFSGMDIVFFAADSDTSKRFVPAVRDAGAVAIDNSSAFRMDPQTPLVVPEVNGEDALIHRGVIANPNCSTILLAMVLAPIHRISHISRVVVSTYQAVSGAGIAAMDELREQSRAHLAGDAETSEIFREKIAFNLFSHDSAVGEDGYNGEESKVIQETRKILHLPSLAVTPTCIRVPIFRAHSESVVIEFADTRPSLATVRDALSRFPGVTVVDNREQNAFPTPRMAAGQDDVFVGRIRDDLSNERAIALFLCGDQILKGAALNGFQIAQYLIERGNLSA